MNLYRMICCFVAVLLVSGCSGTVVQEPTVSGDPYTAVTARVETDQLPSCAHPAADTAARCRTLTEELLAATVRITVRHWTTDARGCRQEYLSGGTGHATVKDGRYLITHNHFTIPLLDLQHKADGEKVEITVFSASTGEKLLQDVPLTSISVQPHGPGSLIFDFQRYGGVGLLQMSGLASARFVTANDVTVTPGTEVAQIDWDGTQTVVTWTRIEAVRRVDGTTIIDLADSVDKGASGGGIFLDGQHIGLNWTRTMLRNKETGDCLDAFSSAVLNMPADLAYAPIR